MPRRLPNSAVRPTQLYLSSEKLTGVLAWFDFDDPDYEPLTAFEHDGATYLADGHTRAFAATLAGADRLRVQHDDDITDDPAFGVYLRCIEWCERAGIETVPDLHGRVVEPDTFQTRWIDRCHALPEYPDT